MTYDGWVWDNPHLSEDERRAIREQIAKSMTEQKKPDIQFGGDGSYYRIIDGVKYFVTSCSCYTDKGLAGHKDDCSKTPVMREVGDA